MQKPPGHFAMTLVTSSAAGDRRARAQDVAALASKKIREKSACAEAIAENPVAIDAILFLDRPQHAIEEREVAGAPAAVQSVRSHDDGVFAGARFDVQSAAQSIAAASMPAEDDRVRALRVVALGDPEVIRPVAIEHAERQRLEPAGAGGRNSAARTVSRPGI